MLVKQGTTGKAVGIFVRKSDGTAYTGLAYNASGFKCYYIREGGSVTSVTLDGTNWTESDATNMPGRYKFIIPDAALASSAKYVEFEFFGAVDMLPVPLRIELVAFDPFTDFTTQVSGIKTQTDKLSFDGSNNVRTLVMELDTSPVDQLVEGVLNADMTGFVAANSLAATTRAIKTKTDQLNFTMANKVDTTVYGMYTSVADQIAGAVWSSSLSGWGEAGDALYNMYYTGVLTDALSSTAQGLVKAQVDASLNTTIPGTPTAGSINDKIKKLTFDGSNYVNAGMQAIGAGVLGAIQNTIWSADPSEWVGVGAGGTLQEVLDMVNGIINTYDGSGYIQAIVMDIDAAPRAAIAGEIWSADLETYGSGYPGTAGYNLYNIYGSLFDSIAEINGMTSVIKSKTDQLNFTGTYVNAQAKGLDANVITATSIASNAITSAKIAANALTAQGVSHLVNTGGLIDDILSGSMGIYSRGTLAGEIQAIADKTDHLSFDANDWVQAYTNGGTIETINDGVDLTPGARQGIWDWATGFITAPGSIGKLIKDNLNATISSRAAAGDQMNLVSGAIDSVAAGVWAANGRSLTSTVDVSSDDITEIRADLVTADDLQSAVDYLNGSIAGVSSQISILQMDLNEEPINLVSYKYRMVTSSGDPIEGVTIRVTRDRESTDEVAPNQDTDSNGETSWILTPGIYYVTRTKTGQTYPNPDIWRIEG